MPDRLCPHCRQPLPPEARRDTLPPLDHPAVVTIHDLPEGAGEVEARYFDPGHGAGGYTVWKLKGLRP
jgi:hypothetical protein